MSNSWFVSPDTKRLPLAPPLGGWIEVRKEISIGDQRGAFAGSIKGTTQTGDGVRTEYDAKRMGFGLVMAYLVDWSAKGLDDKPVAIDTPEKKRAALEALKPDIWEAIEGAVDAHAKAVAEEKKQMNEASSKSSETSPSAG
jgi:hypothetical protein